MAIEKGPVKNGHWIIASQVRYNGGYTVLRLTFLIKQSIFWGIVSNRGLNGQQILFAKQEYLGDMNMAIQLYNLLLMLEINQRLIVIPTCFEYVLL